MEEKKLTQSILQSVKELLLESENLLIKTFQFAQTFQRLLKGQMEGI
jgi:hypothetical protein